MTVEAILQVIRSLSAAEQAEIKARLAEEPNDAVPQLSPELEAELHRRLEAAKANPGVGYTWEEVVEYVKRKK
jgi:hypothetical protein